MHALGISDITFGICSINIKLWGQMPPNLRVIKLVKERGFDLVKLKKAVIAIILGLLILVLGACSTKTDTHKYVDISNVVKEAFVTDKGFSDEISKHMTKEVFNKTNIYNVYPVNSPEFVKPFKVDFSLREISQQKENDKIKVEMIYSVMIHDSNYKTVGGSKDIPITFTVQEVGSGWIITNKEEQP